jgi:antitoxin (DNA-binding transcriptional repressor) of toxin-antitoxin stability system
MQASVIDLRYKTSDIFAALEHGEEVTLLYHGKPKGTIMPLNVKTVESVTEHPFFGMYRQSEESVEGVMDQLRGSRYDF